METLEARVASQIRRVRKRLGLTQSDLARLASIAGASWTQSKIAAMETGRRDIGLGEALILGNLLGVGLQELTVPADSQNDVQVGGVQVTSEQLGRMINGLPVLSGVANAADAAAYIDVMTTGYRRRLAQLVDAFGLREVSDATTTIEAWAHGPAERAAAEQFQTTPEAVSAAAMLVWSRSLTAELRSRRRKGESTETVLAELADAIRRTADDMS